MLWPSISFEVLAVDNCGLDHIKDRFANTKILVGYRAHGRIGYTFGVRSRDYLVCKRPHPQKDRINRTYVNPLDRLTPATTVDNSAASTA